MLITDCIKVQKFLSAMDKNDTLKGKTVLFVTIRNYSLVLHQELFLANIYANLGANVYCLLDDEILDHWDTIQVHQKAKVLNPGGSLKNKIVESLLLRSYSHKNLSIIRLSSYYKEELLNREIDNLDKYDEQNCESSVRRYFEIGKFDRSRNDHVGYYDLSRRNSAKMKICIRNIVDSICPDIAITSHGIYSVWGSAYNVLVHEKNLPTYVYGAHAYNKDTVLFTDTLCQTLSKDSDAISFMKNGIFSDSEKNLISTYFSNRRNHTTKDTSIYYSWIDKQNQSKSFDDNCSSKIPTYCLFTNIIWDGDVAQRDTIFNGMLANTIYTINKFRSLPYRLFVRIHPAEASLWKDSVKMYDILRNEIPDIDSIPNIKIINSSDPIDTYSFVKEFVDVALIYDGMLTLELTEIGCPVIANAVTRYTNGDFVISPQTVEEYDYYLNHPEVCKTFLTKDKIAKMNKFAYWLIFKAGYCFPIYNEKYYSKFDFSANNLSKMRSERYKSFVEKLTSIFYS